MNVPNLPTGNLSVVIDKVIPPTIRFYLYIASFVAIIVLLIVGVVSGTQGANWFMFAGNILGIVGMGVTSAHRPRKLKSKEN